MKRSITGIILLAAALALLGCPGEENNPVVTGSRIGVYNGEGAYEAHAVAVGALLDSLGRDYEFFTAEDAQSGLPDYRLTVISAGDPLAMTQSLGFTGIQSIRELIGRGGGYLGMGAGAYLAADTLIYDGTGSAGSPPLGFYQGRAEGPISELGPINQAVTTLVELTDSRFDPDLTESIESMYRGGPHWLIIDPVYSPIATFVQTGGEAGVVLQFQLGRIALLAFQPEIEEDDPRDGTSFGDDLTDPDSEWFLVRSLAEWCMKEF